MIMISLLDVGAENLIKVSGHFFIYKSATSNKNSVEDIILFCFKIKRNIHIGSIVSRVEWGTFVTGVHSSNLIYPSTSLRFENQQCQLILKPDLLLLFSTVFTIFIFKVVFWINGSTYSKLFF